MTTRLFRPFLPLVLLPLLGAAPAGSSSVPVTATAVPSGEYVEARTASVFAGACHYNGERVTEGRSAVMAWSIRGGAFGGTDLAGVKIAAAVACDDNLAEPAAGRKSEIVIDAPSDRQTAAATAWVKSKLADRLGQIVSVRRGAVAFTHDADEFVVSAGGFVSMDVKPMPGAACCSQPELVWYTPLMPVEGRRVGYTETAAYAGHVGEQWQRGDENSAFYGSFGKGQ